MRTCACWCSVRSVGNSGNNWRGRRSDSVYVKFAEVACRHGLNGEVLRCSGMRCRGTQNT